MPALVHLIELIAQVLQAAVPDRESQEDAPELRFVLVEGAQAVVKALLPDAGPAPLAERAKPRIAEVSGLEVHLRLQVRMKQHISLERVRAVGDSSTDLSRTCVEHQVSADRVVELTVSAELPEYAIIGVRGSLPSRGVGAPWHSGFGVVMHPKVPPPLSTRQSRETPVPGKGLVENDPCQISISYQGKAEQAPEEPQNQPVKSRLMTRRNRPTLRVGGRPRGG